MTSGKGVLDAVKYQQLIVMKVSLTCAIWNAHKLKWQTRTKLSSPNPSLFSTCPNPKHALDVWQIPFSQSPFPWSWQYSSPIYRHLSLGTLLQRLCPADPISSASLMQWSCLLCPKVRCFSHIPAYPIVSEIFEDTGPALFSPSVNRTVTKPNRLCCPGYLEI